MERRQKPRRNCELPLTILQVGDRLVYRSEQTLNISSNGGVCFQSSDPLEVGESVKYEITVSTMLPPVKLICSGRVARCGPARDSARDGEFEIALAMAQYVFAKSDGQILSERALARSAGELREVSALHPTGVQEHCREHSLLLAQFADAARLYGDACRRWLNADTGNANLSRELDAARQTARIKYEFAWMELELHAGRTQLQLEALKLRAPESPVSHGRV